MKLCVNYLMELRELIEEYDLSYIDYIKLFSIDGDLSPFDWCLSKRDVMFHGLIGPFSNIADAKFFENRDIELQRDYYVRGKTPYISVHINKHDDDGRNEEETIKVIVENVKKLKEIFNMRVILENVPASNQRDSYKFVSMPEFITRVVNESDSGFLFDIGHARQASDYLKIPFDEYVSRLPMDRLIEMHLAGSMRNADGVLKANHSKMTEEDYKFVEEALKKYKTVETVTLEYGPFKEKGIVNPIIVDGGSVNPIAKQEVLEQLERLHEIMQRNS